MRKLGFAIVGLAMAGLFGLATLDALAIPRFVDDTDVGKKLFNFNIIVFPGEDFGGPDNDVVCGNKGKRIFFNEDGPGGALGNITWSLNETVKNSFTITDCDGTVDDVASVVLNQAENIWVAIRLLGPIGSDVTLKCSDVVNVSGADICLLDGVTVKHFRSTSFTKIMRSILDSENESVLWEFTANTNAKIIQVWIMQDTS